MSKAIKQLAVTIALAAHALAASAATTVFADAFEDGDVSDWTVSSSANVTAPMVTVRTDSVHAGTGALWTYFDAPGGGLGAGYVRASHTFSAAVAADYDLSLWARSSPCSGCTMYYNVLVDGNLLTHTGTAQAAFESRSFTLANLSAGTHTLTLGLYTTGASSGRFNATFDDVLITTEASIAAAVPEPETYALMLAGIGLLAARRRAAPG